MDGIILLNKEKGPTSFSVIEDLKRKFKIKKIGHGGTLDPMAEGLLMVLLGNATKLNPYLPSDKTYEAEITFGAATDTDDAEGAVIQELPVPENLEEKLRDVLLKFTGEIMQKPPKYSAIRKDGKKLYELARAGEEVNPEPRKAFVHYLEITSVTGNRVSIRSTVETGTYIRSIARDLGEAIGTCAHLTALTRTKIGTLTLTDSVRFNEVESVEKHIIPMSRAIDHLPEALLDKRDYETIKNGGEVARPADMKGLFVRMTYNGSLAAIGEISGPFLKVKRGIDFSLS